MDARGGRKPSRSALPGPPGSGSVKCSPWYATGSRAMAIRTTSMYSRVRASPLPNGTPCQPSDTCGPDSPRPSRNRPPDSASMVVAVIAVMAGVRAGICITAAPTSIRSVCPAIQASTLGASELYASAAHTTE
jgi:hypothetical protein